MTNYQDIEVTVGWTKSEVEIGEDGREHLVYSSFGDGYRPGARQHTETFTLPKIDVEHVDPEDLVTHIADAAFLATNHPNPSALTGIPGNIYACILASGYRGQGAHYSLSKGDTVVVGEIALACESIGWKRVSMAGA